MGKYVVVRGRKVFQGAEWKRRQQIVDEDSKATRYTGKPCRACRSRLRRVSNGICVQCHLKVVKRQRAQYSRLIVRKAKMPRR